MNTTTSNAATLYEQFQARGIQLTAEPTETRDNGMTVHDWRIWAKSGQFAPGDWDKVKRHKNGLVRLLKSLGKIEHRMGDVQEQTNWARPMRTGKAMPPRHVPELEPPVAQERVETVFAPYHAPAPESKPKRAENWMEGRVKPTPKEPKQKPVKTPKSTSGVLKNETGNRYGCLVVVGLSKERTIQRGAQWECLCDCGATTTVLGAHLRAGRTRSCGHLPTGRPPLPTPPIGTRFGLWTVVGPSGHRTGQGFLCVQCRCDCGREKPVAISYLLKKWRPSESCGRCTSGPKFSLDWNAVDWSKTNAELTASLGKGKETIRTNRMKFGQKKEVAHAPKP